MLSVGLKPAYVRRLFLIEAACLAAVGTALGSIAGLGYTQLVLRGLATIWRDAVGATALAFHATPTTVLMGAGISFAAALGAIWLAFRGPFRRPALELLGGAGVALDARRVASGKVGAVVAVGAGLGCVALIVSAGDGSAAAGSFFGAGALFLVSSLAVSRLLLGRVALGAAVRRAGRRGHPRPAQRHATAGAQPDDDRPAGQRHLPRARGRGEPARVSPGRLGALLGDRRLRPLRSLEPAGPARSGLRRRARGLGADLGGELADVRIVPMRVREGDDASCLNLSLPQNPQLVGVTAEQLAARESFTFAGVAGGSPQVENPWLLLDRREPGGPIPAIGDQASVTWAMHKALGDELEYTDERGRSFRVRIVATVSGSLLQGNLLIAERAFQELFPSESGYRMFLIDAPPELADEASRVLGRGPTRTSGSS